MATQVATLLSFSPSRNPLFITLGFVVVVPSWTVAEDDGVWNWWLGLELRDENGQCELGNFESENIN